MKGSWAVGIGSVLGSCIIFPLILHFFTAVNIKKNDATSALPVYMQRSISIKTIIPVITQSKDREITLRYTKQGDDRSDVSDQVFYLPAYKKYFVYEQFDVPNPVYTEDTLVNKPVMLRINQDDLHNPELGTSQHPVPVFNIWRANPLAIKNEQTGKTDTIYPNFKLNSYKYNVHMYLTYIMPKEEFNERFKPR